MSFKFMNNENFFLLKGQMSLNYLFWMLDLRTLLACVAVIQFLDERNLRENFFLAHNFKGVVCFVREVATIGA